MQAAAISSRNLIHSLMLVLATLAIPGPAGGHARLADNVNQSSIRS